ncbi:restriction endonuclease [Clostridium botulinum]|uniref:restriction endonuclease n=1 Tax=Clostridium sp. M14 TaxID=2716311 RepID=UPI000689CBED|nr:restriction endonuclease [Clostridium sp. M14]MBY6778031.1 restriction endonuclease [Clostridium botulinum]MBY6850981.1 restriction endonuclease [Clostridium botulinum]MBZ9691650.1 restriction endonuclease [Clostridium sp. M14]NFI50322.1 restriction endonuclease [Clostridium botulinum]NFI71519.1 restriction endonuclease [Clostridium botulinum]
MIRDILEFIINNLTTVIIMIIVLYLIYNWITMFINKDYKFFEEYNKKYANRVLTGNDIRTIKNELKDMDGRDFELLCEWLFKKSGKYKSVILTPEQNDGGKDLILVNENNETIFVECKRYTENASSTENFMIGREICQKLIGAMVVDNIKSGIIITTGNVHINAWNYINKLEENTDIRIDVITLDEIMNIILEINSSEILSVVKL